MTTSVIIEHPKRGVYVEFNDNTDKPRFSIVRLRNDAEIRRFFSAHALRKEVARWRSDRLIGECFVVQISSDNQRVDGEPQKLRGWLDAETWPK